MMCMKLYFLLPLHLLRITLCPFTYSTKMCTRPTASVFYCYLNNLPQTEWLKKNTSILSSSSVGRKVDADLTRLKSGFLLEPLGEDLVPDHSDCWQNSIPGCCRTKVCFLAGCPPRRVHQHLEATPNPWLVVLLPQVQSQQWRSPFFTRRISFTHSTQPLSLFKSSCD